MSETTKKDVKTKEDIKQSSKQEPVQKKQTPKTQEETVSKKETTSYGSITRTINGKTLPQVRKELNEEFPEEEHYERSGFTYISGDAVKNRLMNVLGDNLDIIMVRENIVQDVPMRVKGKIESYTAMQCVVELAIYYDLEHGETKRTEIRRVQGVGGSAKQLGLSPLNSIDSLAKSARTYAIRNAAEALGVAFYLRTEQLIEQAVEEGRDAESEKRIFPTEIVDMFAKLKKDTGVTSDDILSYAQDFDKSIKSLKHFTVKENATKKEKDAMIKKAEELVEYINQEI